MKRNILLLLASVNLLCACRQEKATRERLIGEWEFDTFEPAGNLTPERKKLLDEAIATNKGIRLIFGADGSFSSTYDPDQKPSRFVFIPHSQQVVMLGDTSEVIELNDRQMKLYRDKRSPVAVFKRLH